MTITQRSRVFVLLICAVGIVFLAAAAIDRKVAAAFALLGAPLSRAG